MLQDTSPGAGRQVFSLLVARSTTGFWEASYWQRAWRPSGKTTSCER